jgi:hypothetical protein
MTQDETAVVYVVSPDREDQLFRSLDSLLISGSSFETVRICCTGCPPGHWRFADPRVRVETVEPLYGKYFYGNKLHLCDTHASRVIFLDADTVVLRPLDALWRCPPELLARRGTAMSLPGWNRRAWRSLFRDLGSHEVPMFNAGMLIFQRGSHARVKAAWHSNLLRFLAGDLPHPWPDKRMFEQWSLAVAVAQTGTSFGELGSQAHAFGWQEEPADGVTVFHYGNRHFNRLSGQFPPMRPLDRLLAC